MLSEKDRVSGLKRRFDRLKEERDKRLSDWKAVQKYVAPSVLNWDNPADKIPKRSQRFTGRPTQYNRTLRSGLVGYSISPNIVWQKLTLDDHHNLDKIYGAKDWLEIVERKLYAEFKKSNLYQQAGLMIENAVLYGHGVMLIDEVQGENRLRFTTLKTQETFFDINEYDEIDTVFRRYCISLSKAASFFGKENLSEIQQEELDRITSSEAVDREITIIHAVYKRDEYDENLTDVKNMPYASIYIDESENRFLMESGYNDFPFAVFIWEPVTGTPYGESPAIQALDDIRILNKLDEQILKIAQMAGSPAYNVPDSMRDHVNVVPNGYNYFKDPQQIVSPVNSGLNFPITLEIYNKKIDQVKDWFFVDFFIALQQQNRPNMTATEVMELQGEKAATLSDIVVNINSALEKIIQRSFNILWRQGKIPQPPIALANSGAELKVDFLGPLAQAQKKYHESAGIGQAINIIGAISKIAPAALDVVDFDVTMKRGLEGVGFPQEAIREEKDIEELRKQRAEQEAKQRQEAAAMETQKNIMGNANKLNEPVKPGSIMSEMNQQMAGMGAVQ